MKHIYNIIIYIFLSVCKNNNNNENYVQAFFPFSALSSLALMYLLYSVIAVGLGTEIFCQRSTVSPLYTGWKVEHRETSRVSIHLTNRRSPSLTHRMLPRGDLLVRTFSCVLGTPTRPCL